MILNPQTQPSPASLYRFKVKVELDLIGFLQLYYKASYINMGLLREIYQNPFYSIDHYDHPFNLITITSNKIDPQSANPHKQKHLNQLQIMKQQQNNSIPKQIQTISNITYKI